MVKSQTGSEFRQKERERLEFSKSYRELTHKEEEEYRNAILDEIYLKQTRGNSKA
jgi:hypothetical protein